jgi:hypothetical protein
MTALLKAPHLRDFPHTIVEMLGFADTDRNGYITSSVFAVCCRIGPAGPVRSGAWVGTAKSQLRWGAFSSQLQWPGDRGGGHPCGTGWTVVRDVGLSAFLSRPMCCNCALGYSLDGCGTRRPRSIPPVLADMHGTFILSRSARLADGVQRTHQLLFQTVHNSGRFLCAEGSWSDRFGYQSVEPRRNQGARTTALGVSGNACLRRHLEPDCRSCEHGVFDGPSWQPHDKVRFMNIGQPQRDYIRIGALVEPDVPRTSGRRRSHHNPRSQQRTET